jgi:hypothetical protein
MVRGSGYHHVIRWNVVFLPLGGLGQPILFSLRPEDHVTRQERLVMGLIPGYENDIFISYAHNDNLSVMDFEWVDWFHENLENLLIGKLGERPVIWRDRRMDQTDLIEGLLDSRVNTSALMLVIVSPSYLKSKWCGWERKTFVENAAKRGGLRVANKSRIIKVVKIHEERTVLPEELQETLGSEFLRHEQAAGRYVELDPQSSEALVGFQGRGCADGVQPDFCYPLFLEALLFQWPSK